jgi:hypothetical protein
VSAAGLIWKMVLSIAGWEILNPGYIEVYWPDPGDFFNSAVSGILRLLIMSIIGFLLIVISKEEATKGINLISHLRNRGENFVSEDPGDFEAQDFSSGSFYKFHLSQYCKTGWGLFKTYPGGFLGFSAILMVFIRAEIFLYHYQPVLGLLLTAFLALLGSGSYIVSAKLLQRQPCRFSDFFSGFHYLKPLLIFGFLDGILILGIHLNPAEQVVLREIPTIVELVFLTIFLFTPLLIIDRKLDWWAAMQLSWRTMRRRPLLILGLIVLLPLLHLVWMIIFIPVFSGIVTAAYADIFGLQSQDY